MGQTAKASIKKLLDLAGVTINGDQPWDVRVYNEQVYERIIQNELLGLGEAYMDLWWDCPLLDDFFYRVSRANLDTKMKKNKLLLFHLFVAKFFNLQNRKRALEVAKKHYDLGNHLFKCMLDSRMNYTCAYWKNAKNLDEAQLAKLELVCQKLKLEPGMRLLDVGCGWGGLAKYAAEKYGAHVIGITISKEQFQYAKKNCEGLPVEIRLQDYRDLNDHFDRAASIGMFEAVGHLNYRIYLQKIHHCLPDDGLFLLHTIGNNLSTFKTNEWIDKYIFPNGSLPSIPQIGKASEGLFIMEDWHNFGADYDKTLMAWHQNFNRLWDELKTEYDERFRRMWNYYLLSCAGSFRARDMQLWQIVFSKKGLVGGYESVR